jgi:hypothetical protein
LGHFYYVLAGAGYVRLGWEGIMNVLQQILIAIDACEERRYEDARELLKDVPICIIRTRDAGVHFGKLEFIANAQHGCYRVAMSNCRRLFNWQGAFTLNQVAVDGPQSGRASIAHEIHIPQVIEVIPCTDKAIAKLGTLV